VAALFPMPVLYRGASTQNHKTFFGRLTIRRPSLPWPLLQVPPAVILAKTIENGLGSKFKPNNEANYQICDQPAFMGIAGTERGGVNPECLNVRFWLTTDSPAMSPVRLLCP
jgi:hypothetical protein